MFGVQLDDLDMKLFQAENQPGASAPNGRMTLSKLW